MVSKTQPQPQPIGFNDLFSKMNSIWGQLKPDLAGIPQPAPPPQMPTPPAGWMDLTQPGQGEQAARFVAGQLKQPGQLEDWWSQNSGFFSQPSWAENFLQNAAQGFGTPSAGETMAGDAAHALFGAANRFGAQTPGESFVNEVLKRGVPEAGLDPYYDNAKRRALESINQNAAARGVYGSSAAIDSGSEAVANLEAEKANREAEFDLNSRLGLGQLGLGAGQLGLGRGIAGANALNASGNLGLGAGQLGLGRGIAGANAANAGGALGLNRNIAGVNGASAAQLAGLNRLSTLLNAGTTGQTLREGRVRGAFNDTAGLGGQVFGPSLGAGMGAIGNDMDFLQAIGDALLGKTTSGIGAENQQGVQKQQDISNWLELMSKIYGGGGLFGGGGNWLGMGGGPPQQQDPNAVANALQMGLSFGF